MGNLNSFDDADSRPDIRRLFRHYDELYFGSKLGACTVDWSSRRTVDAGSCIYKEDGACQLRLSEPILKSRSEGDLKATLLHEMIHAYLFFTVKSADRNDHGDLFRSKMNKINNSRLQDDERPEEGYHIGVTHSFKAAPLHWKCQTCGDTIEKDGNIAPSAADCIGKSNSSESCLRLQCPWHMHKEECSGTYVKRAGASGQRGLQKFEEANGKQESTSKAENKRKLEIGYKSKAGEVHSKVSRLEWFYAKGQITGDEQPCKSSDVKSAISTKELLKGARVKRSPSKRITKKTVEPTDSTSDGPPVIIGWKGWWAWEREEDEEGVESLIDRRREKRAREKESEGVMKLADECAKILVEGTSATEGEPDHFQNISIWSSNRTSATAVIDLEESPRKEGSASEGERSKLGVPSLKTYCRRRERKKIQIEATAELVTPGEIVKCPVCQKVFICDPNKPQDNADINTHVDECLNAGFRAAR